MFILFKMIIAFFCAILLWTLADGSAIVFNATSSSIKPLITRDLTLTCLLKDTSPNTSGGLVGRSVDDVTRLSGHQSDDVTLDNRSGRARRSLTNTTENVDFVTSIAISLDGVDIAIVSDRFPARAVVASPDIVVTGSLSEKSGVRGILQVTFPAPTNNQAGKYRCDVDSINSLAHSFDFSQVMDIDEEEVSMNDLVQELHDLRVQMVKGSDVKNQASIQALENQDNALNTSIQALKNENNALKLEIQKLNNTASLPRVFFSASLKVSGIYTSGHIVKYDVVHMNEGSGYNPRTGVFTCPVSGYYKFHVDAASYGSRGVALNLQQNNVSRIQVVSDGTRGYTSASNTVILKLLKSDTVKVVSNVSSSYLYGGDNNLRNTFTGNLLAVV